MQFVVLGWPDEGPTLRLDHRRFPYAGKFVMTDTGKAVVRDDDLAAPESDYDEAVLAAVSFSPDRGRTGVWWLRYVAVRDDHRGAGLGPRLCRFAVERLRDWDAAEVRIAVNNPFAYHAVHKAGFGWTGETAGLAELVCSTAASSGRYQDGLDRFRERDRPEPEQSFLAAKAGDSPPEPVW